jgi:hypothetical protein
MAERRETIAALRESLQNEAAGRVQPMLEGLAELAVEYGLRANEDE